MASYDVASNICQALPLGGGLECGAGCRACSEPGVLARSGRGGFEDKHSTDGKSPPPHERVGMSEGLLRTITRPTLNILLCIDPPALTDNVFIVNKHSTDFQYPPPPPRVGMSTDPEVESCCDISLGLVFGDPPIWRASVQRRWAVQAESWSGWQGIVEAAPHVI